MRRAELKSTLDDCRALQYLLSSRCRQIEKEQEIVLHANEKARLEAKMAGSDCTRNVKARLNKQLKDVQEELTSKSSAGAFEERCSSLVKALQEVQIKAWA